MCWLSLPHLVSNGLNFLCTELYNNSTPTFFLCVSQIALIQPIHGQGYTLLLDRMHLLFTQLHFLFWLHGRVVGQYTTAITRTDIRQSPDTIFITCSTLISALFLEGLPTRYIYYSLYVDIRPACWRPSHELSLLLARRWYPSCLLKVFPHTIFITCSMYIFVLLVDSLPTLVSSSPARRWYPSCLLKVSRSWKNILPSHDSI